MKHLLILLCCLCAIWGLCGCAENSTERKTDYLHYKTETLSLDITPPESWPETAAPLTLRYGSLDTAALESVLTGPVETQRIDTLEHEEGESEAEAAEHYWKNTLSGPDGAWWVFWETEGSWDNQDNIPFYWYNTADGTFVEPTGTHVRKADFDEETQAASEVADAFLAQIGLPEIILVYGVTEPNVGCSFFYNYYDDIFLAETGCREPAELWGVGITVIVENNTVTHVDINDVVTEITGQDEQPLISPAEAAEILATEYSDDTNNVYAFTALELRYFEVKDYEAGTGEARPAWVFYDVEGNTMIKQIAVDAITGEIL